MDALTPDGIAPPFAAYSHGVAVPAGHRLVLTSGQLGLTRAGEVPEGARSQAAVAFCNIDAILAEAGAVRAVSTPM